ncbi:hypothetical protein [Corynebacterium sp. HS2168-gen11]|uniref:hypothetical protein n=1 Tax=Corynebacterium sp. HS2168-gen11 TaxID=2974027 RepID=UPI00216AD34C|nr:hypothetical protein [Corynebacterium sp. HS2168-gen11]MCS4536344.1 hypothetical protein [Corynebacterium sp. HS2168-gen11]
MIQKWIKEHQTISVRSSIPGCTAAPPLFLETNLVGASKILKIKRLIRDLGGVKHTVQLMWGASFSYEKMHEAGAALATLVGEFFGITSIRNECFN